MTAAAVGLNNGSVLQLMSVYNTNTVIGTNGGQILDKFGNAVGSNNDLGVDEAFKGMQITVLHLYTKENFDFKLAQRALEKKGFSVIKFTSLPPASKLAAVLEQSNQLWLISSYKPSLKPEHVAMIKSFFDSGRGLYIWGDNEPFFADANVLGEALFNTTMSGNIIGDQCVQVQNEGIGPGFTEHAVMTGISTLFEGVTIATIAPNANITPILFGSAGNLVVAAFEQDCKRALIDGGFTRLFCNWDTAGTERYVINAAVWLVNFEHDW
eukprot:c4110_g1_i1.p1 GENE.c4110_g1_i1~~c4110_g1_i1.p1  ORF type:complete len:268 (+),score=58.13 c4110_g1_i1:504-1307(+)